MQGPDQLANFLSILFRADLKRLVEGRVHGFYFIQHPQAPGIFVPTSTDGRWNFGMQWHPEQGERLEDYDRERCLTLVRTATGAPALDVELVGVQAFTFAAQVAQRYRKGNVYPGACSMWTDRLRGGRNKLINVEF
jgi:putative polyketide hydroxylase